MSINDVIAVGEYTFQSLADDWFLVFVKKDKSWVRISMYAEGINRLFDFLSEKISIELKDAQLANSTEWNSIISFPISLRGKNIFKRVDENIELSEKINQLLSASR